MIKQLKKWWYRDRDWINQRLTELEHERQEEKAGLEQQLEEANTELTALRNKTDENQDENENHQNSIEPWVEIKSANIDPVKGIQIELDWNGAFIQYLKDNGLTGRDEETAVQKWLAFLYENLIDRLEQKVVDKSDEPRASDFEG